MNSYAEAYRRAKALTDEAPEALLSELDRVLTGAPRDHDPRLDETIRLAEMALVAKLDPWWAGPPQPNIRTSIQRLDRSLGDPIALGLGLRLAAGYARAGRVDDEAHALGRLCVRLSETGLTHPEAAYAQQGARHLEQALFLPSPHYAYEMVKELPPEEAAERIRVELARGNPSFAALLAELRLVRALDDWFLGPPLKNVESALAQYRAERPPEWQDVAILLARAYMQGAFVDLRAREHVRGVLDGQEARLLGPEEAIALQEYVDRDCFDYPYAELYQVAKAAAPGELRGTVRRHVKNGSLTAGQRLCEMALVRRFDDWYLGDPSKNVRRAIERYLAIDPSGEPDAAWCARTLAGLYAATLEGESHARRLVHAIVTTEPESEDFLAATHAAGIPADVSAAELFELYTGVVEIDAKVEAFRALADETSPAGRALNDYERDAYAEVLRFLEQDETTPWGDVASSLSGLVEVVVPDMLVRNVTSVVEDALRFAASGARATLRRERILSELAQRDASLRTLEAIRAADLELLDEVAWSVTLENRVVAALEGFGCGLGGATLVLVDLPMLVLVNLNAVASVATAYGFDIDDPEERNFALALLAGGPTALRQLIASGADLSVEHPLIELGSERLAANRGALALHATAARIAGRLARQKLLQLLPVLGGAVGAGLNFHFTHTTARTAVMAYRYRWMVRRFVGA